MPTFSRLEFSRFDRIVFLALFGLLLAAGLLLWRGNRVGLQVIDRFPPEDGREISTKAAVRITFDQPLQTPAEDFSLTLTPAVTGTLQQADSTLIFTPAALLAPKTTYRVKLTAQSPEKAELSWQFHTAELRLLYISQDENGIEQLYVTALAGREPRQLTQESWGVFDYAVAPDGSRVVYTALREDGGSDLWFITAAGQQQTPLLFCPEAVCNGVVWHPDGSRLLYERRNMLVPGAAPGPPRLWWLNPASGETVPVFEDSQIISYGAAWSPDGQWLSYLAPASQGVQIYNITDGRSVLIPSRIGELARWSPTDNLLLITDIQPRDEGFAVHLLQARPEKGQLIDLSGEQHVEDSFPAWSPDGRWIAFTRKAAGAAMGKQLWLMRADGSQARYLTARPEIHYSTPQWSPDGRYLVFQGFPLKELGATPALWLLNIETEQLEQVVPSGSRPTWLP